MINISIGIKGGVATKPLMKYYEFRVHSTSNRQISNILQLFQILIHWNCLVGSFLCLESLKSHFCWRFSRKIRKILSEIFQFFLFWYSRWPCQKKVAWLRKEQFRRSTVCPSAAQYPKNFYVKVPSLRQLVLKWLLESPPLNPRWFYWAQKLRNIQFRLS